jgi:hypothetical protein
MGFSICWYADPEKDANQEGPSGRKLANSNLEHRVCLLDTRRGYVSQNRVGTVRNTAGYIHP